MMTSTGKKEQARRTVRDDELVSSAIATRERLMLVSDQSAGLVLSQALGWPPSMPERHHILFGKNSWNSTVPTKMLREHTTLIPKLDPAAHNALHANPELVDGVPLLGQAMARRVLQRFEGSPGNARGSLGELMHIVETESHNARTPRVQRLLAESTLAALEVQRQYLPR